MSIKGSRILRKQEEPCQAARLTESGVQDEGRSVRNFKPQPSSRTPQPRWFRLGVEDRMEVIPREELTRAA